MEREFEKFIEENHLFNKKDKLLVALSGGVDSMVLCDVLHKLGYQFAIAHCNFGLRGEESDGDEAFVKETAAQIGVRVHSKYFDTEGVAAKNKLSLQEVARQVRYKWFEELRKMYHYKSILTAHHANDNVETVLFNFAKGTGLRGMRGILPKNQYIARPLLWATKETILEYASENNIQFREDSSNNSDKYSRNFIRHQIVPAFESINPQFVLTANENMQLFTEAYELLKFFINQIKKNLVKYEDENLIIDLNILSSYPSVETILYEILKEYAFHPNQISQILQQNSMKTKTGTTFYSESHVLLIDRNSLIVKKNELKHYNNEFNVEIDTHLVFISECHQVIFRRVIGESIDIIKDKNIALLDINALSFPLKLRHWRRGDSFRPLGMKGKSQKLSDYFVHQKISNFDKDKIWILETAKGEICWIIGHRIDERFKITEGVQAALRVDFLT